MALASKEELRERIAAKSVAKVAARPKPQGRRLSAELPPPKVCIYAPIGKGKTFFLLGPLLAGEKIYVVSTDFGSNGLITIVNYLRRIGRLDLLDNLRYIDLNEYEDIIEFFKNPLAFEPDLVEWKPDVLAWEGFSNFNNNILDEYILAMDPSTDKASELREAGLFAGQQDWGGIKRGTMRPLTKFMACEIPGAPAMAKILTAHEDGEIKVNDLDNNKAEKGLLIQGSARKMMAGPFDVVLNAFAEEKKVGDKLDIRYFYRCAGDSSKYVVKSRGYDLKPIEPADPERVWKIIRATGGGFGEELKD